MLALKRLIAITLLSAFASAGAAQTVAAPAPTSASQAAPIDQSKGTESKKGKDGKKKEKKIKPTPMSISEGTLTVDGYTAKAALNYDIPNLRFLYVWSPGIGTTVISNAPFPLAKEQENAFNDATLTVMVEDHQIQITSARRLLGKKPASAWVYLNKDYAYPSKYPAVGYGDALSAPYAWPGSKAYGGSKEEGVVKAPPLPASVLPLQLPRPCPAPLGRPAAAGAPAGGCAPAPPAAVAKPATPAPAMPAPAPAAPTPAAAPAPVAPPQ